MQHSNLIGGSTTARIIACPYSMSAPKHPQPESPFAEEGTYLHDVMEKILLGELLEDEVKDYEGMTQELLDEKVYPALEAFDTVTDEYVPEGEDWTDYLPEAEYHYTGELAGCFGTTDFVGRHGKTLLILDWKFGDGVAVSPVENTQMKFYCGAIMDTNPNLFYGVEDIAFCIVQPIRGKDCEPLLWHTTVEDIKEFRGVLATTLATAQGDNPPMQTGDHCRFCDHKPLCPEVQGMVSTALLAQPDAMTPEELAKALETVDIIEQYGKDIRKLAFSVLEEGYDLPGFKLVAKRATRKWTDTEAVEKKLKGMKASLTDCKERPKLKSPAQVEKILKKAEKDFSKLSDLIVKESSGNTVAPESDKREAVETLPKQLDELAEQLNIN